MKVGFVIIGHYSEKYRSKGIGYLHNCISSLKESVKGFDYEIILIDNGSEVNLCDIFTDEKIRHHRIYDQFIGGLTLPLNLAVPLCKNFDCDIVITINDDLVFDESINNLIDAIIDDEERDNTFYGVMTNNTTFLQQMSPTLIHDDPIELSGRNWDSIINGFVMAHTMGFHDKFSVGGVLFFGDAEYVGYDGKWGGQEGMQFKWVKQGARLVIVRRCWVYHIKERGWKKLREDDKKYNYGS